MPLCRRIVSLLTSTSFLRSAVAGAIAGTSSALLHVADLEYQFLEEMLPDAVVFESFIMFVALVGGFRTAHALTRYTEAASLLHRLSGCWFDTASTLVAFCRISDASGEQISEFQDTLLRLCSMLSALCLENLELGNNKAGGAHRYEVMGWDDFDEDFQRTVATLECKVEYIFQAVHQLVVDSIKTKVITIDPSILSRSFQELGAGMLTFHEAKKLSQVPLPFAYGTLTYIILICQAAFTPFFLAMHVKGTMSSFFFSFCGTFLLWFLNGVADSLDNPFRKESSSLEPGKVQSDLNIQLHELRKQGNQTAPAMNRRLSTTSILHRRASLGTVRQRLSNSDITWHSSDRGSTAPMNHQMNHVNSIYSISSLKSRTGFFVDVGISGKQPVQEFSPRDTSELSTASTRQEYKSAATISTDFGDELPELIPRESHQQVGGLSDSPTARQKLSQPPQVIGLSENPQDVSSEIVADTHAITREARAGSAPAAQHDRADRWNASSDACYQLSDGHSDEHCIN